MFTLMDKVAVVTGATSGIGRAIAIKLADAGAKVAVLGRDGKRAEELVSYILSRGCTASAFLGDISVKDNCIKLMDEVYACFGRIDILVNCAGILTSTHMEDITTQEWNQIIDTNLSGSFFMIQSVLPYLRKNGSGRIINIGSNAGRMGGYENSQAYTASKGGMIAITKGIARQLAKEQITVNCVCPGTTETEMVKMYNQEARERLISRIPMGRFGKPDEIAAAVCFFCSEEAGYITGAVLDVNGGMYMN